VSLAYDLRARLWIYPGAAAWHFLTLPKAQAKEIRGFFGHTRGWGSLPVEATIGGTTWRTSIFPDSKSNSYLLPVKAAVRKAEGLEADTMVRFRIVVQP
jgi:hypothetical protein